MEIMSAEPKPGNFATLASPQAAAIAAARPLKGAVSAYGRPLEFFGNRFVYAVISQRAHGLSIGINMNPDKACNFDCAYCEVNRDLPSRDSSVDLQTLVSELETLLSFARGRDNFEMISREVVFDLLSADVALRAGRCCR